MKIIGSDYDGTLNHKGIDDIKRAAIHAWRAAGNVFAVVSGRGIDRLSEFYSKHGFECDYFVGYNGAVIAKPDGTVVFSAECDGKVIPSLVEYILENGCFNVFIEADRSIEVCSEKIKRDENGRLILNDIPKVGTFYQVSTMCDDCAAAEVLTAGLKANFGDVLNPLQNGICIDIVRKDINKAQGLYALMELLGAKYEDIIAVGDNVNDRDMIAEFRSYAMENAVDQIKAIADYITPGVTELIEKELAPCH